MGERILRFLLNRLREPSTWRGLILVFTAAGWYVKPELAEAIIALGLALAGGVGAVAPDRPERLRRVSGPPGPAAGDADGPHDPTNPWRGFKSGYGG